MGSRIGLGTIIVGGLLIMALISLSVVRPQGSQVQNLSWFVKLMFPPDISVLSIAWTGIQETLHVAYLGTLGGFLFAPPLALLASRNLFPIQVGMPIRWVLASLRVMPSILWALIFVILVGLGPFAGTLALVFYTTGYLGKLMYESFEGLATDTFQALQSMGASKLQILRFAVIPEAANNILSQVLFMFEYNVRHSSIIGIVGAGGIGFYLSSYLKFFEYGKVLTLLIIIFILVVAIDTLSGVIRQAVLGAGKSKQPWWKKLGQAVFATLG